MGCTVLVVEWSGPVKFMYGVGVESGEVYYSGIEVRSGQVKFVL